MITEITNPNILRKDPDGNWYSIPEHLDKTFIAMKEELMTFDWGSKEWDNVNDDFADIFGQYLK